MWRCNLIVSSSRQDFLCSAHQNWFRDNFSTYEICFISCSLLLLGHNLSWFQAKTCNVYQCPSPAASHSMRLSKSLLSFLPLSHHNHTQASPSLGGKYSLQCGPTTLGFCPILNFSPTYPHSLCSSQMVSNRSFAIFCPAFLDALTGGLVQNVLISQSQRSTLFSQRKPILLMIFGVWQAWVQISAVIQCDVGWITYFVCA